VTTIVHSAYPDPDAIGGYCWHDFNLGYLKTPSDNCSVGLSRLSASAMPGSPQALNRDGTCES
jgi:hypothetical protein